LILTKISKIRATRSQILRLKCTKFDFCFLLGELTALPRLPSCTSKGEGKGRGGAGKGKGRGGGLKGPPFRVGIGPPKG